MPLARIIASSAECWRELALDLLARRYAVEIVSPDAIPDNFADLELRVDSDKENGLKANVTVRRGEGPTSLNLVDHLKSPMEDFIRRPPNTGASVPAQNPAVLKSETAVKEIELPSDHSTDLASVVSDQPVRLAGSHPGAAARRGITIIIHRSRPKKRSTKSRWSRGWLLRSSAGALILLALGGTLISGIRSRVASVQSGPTDSAALIPSATSASMASPESQSASQSPAEPLLQSQGEKEEPLQIPGPVYKPRESAQLFNSSLGNTNGLTSEDVVSDRDKSSVKTGRQTKFRRHRHDGKVAHDTVTYLHAESKNRAQ